ncbi:hypothetical protein [Polaromonas aquatica]|uniref:hypothetical protein n=1 Tax=Polaromonas aquatica TaxID=332657 RepID=UPI003D64F37E
MLSLHLLRAAWQLTSFTALSLVARVRAFRDRQGGGSGLEIPTAALLGLMSACDTAQRRYAVNIKCNWQTLLQHLPGARRTGGEYHLSLLGHEQGEPR